MSTFPEILQSLSDDQLRLLIRTRPDAFFPTPPSAGSLATRLGLPGSASRALRQLTAADLAVLERLADAGAELDPVDAGELGDVAHLRELALVFGPVEALRISPGTLTALPPGWRVTDTLPEGAAEALDALPARERKVLETLASSGGVGTTSAAGPDADPSAPVAKLLAAGLLVRVDANTVRLPRPVRDAMRGITPREFPLAPPAVDEVDQSAVDEAATSAGLDAVRQMRQLVMALMDRPVTLNKDGTVGVRAAANLEKELGFDPRLLITIGEAAGLIGRGNVDDEDVLAATRDALTWIDATLSDQWAILMVGWAASPWRSDTVAKLLSTDMHAPAVRHARTTILRHAGNVDQLLFHAPLEASGFSPQLIQAVVDEAQFVGALAGTSQPAQSSPLLALLDGEDVAAAAKALVPASVDTLIAQGDMTMLAPGPLEPDMASFLERIAELESPGLASVWRVTEASVRRGLDGGLTAEEVHAWLGRHVMGEVPQAIAFLIDDTARTHGAIRAGSALSYIRSADPALIATAAERCDLRVLAPTVAVSDQPLTKLMSQLRAAGMQPTAEDGTGATLNMAPEPALVAATPSTLPRASKAAEEQVEAIVAKLRADAGSDTDTGAGNIFETLRAAARARRHVAVGFVDKQGRGRTLTVLPLSVSAGQVDALDEAADRVVRIALPRITKVVLA
ncbi:MULTISPECIES: helicase-associated domain-containing protein [unclassified Corynebacterium]|uniref:helicase-associated domain-containing protein n=1 Tax=unclassified Corynebacterium TaxID=2624378 RepID=UPI001EF71E38|nr:MULTISPECIES: helicase-associated domain-containing protein [unclassified Corynebacterium]MCG7288477.1 helicase-associated domain-containing protein [Corynebacterium sp. ACRPZ]MCG7293216.1 helicase-associated domain-containing protein [Corynebacterium sp. ACRPY]